MTADSTESAGRLPGLEAARARLGARLQALDAGSIQCLERSDTLTQDCRTMSAQIDNLVDGFNAEMDEASGRFDASRQELSDARNALAQTVREGEDRVRQLNRTLFWLRAKRAAPLLIILVIVAALIGALLVFGADLGIVVSEAQPGGARPGLQVTAGAGILG